MPTALSVNLNKVALLRNARNGDRLVEIGGVELLNHIPTGRSFHRYLNPGRPVHPDAVAVHGLTDAFLADKPRFEAVVDEFLAFVGDSVLVAHNSGFDREFINAELERAARPPLSEARFVDTLLIARRRHPGAANSLDALCARGLMAATGEGHAAGAAL